MNSTENANQTEITVLLAVFLAKARGWLAALLDANRPLQGARKELGESLTKLVEAVEIRCPWFSRKDSLNAGRAQELLAQSLAEAKPGAIGCLEDSRLAVMAFGVIIASERDVDFYRNQIQRLGKGCLIVSLNFMRAEGIQARQECMALVPADKLGTLAHQTAYRAAAATQIIQDLTVVLSQKLRS